MRGHVRKRGNNWYVVVELPRGVDGKRKQKWISAGERKKDAEALRSKLLHEMNTGEYVEPTKITFGEYLKRWLKASARPTVSAKTYERYEDIALKNIAPALGHIPLAKLQPLHIQAYYSTALESGSLRGTGGLSARTVLHHHRVIHRALAQAVKWQMIARNPADSVDPPRPQSTEMQALTGDEAKSLLVALEGTRLHLPTLLAISTGLRRGEILALRWSDIDLDTGTLTVQRSLEQTREGLRFKEPKTKRSRRTIALAPTTVRSLRTHRLAQSKARLQLGLALAESDLVSPNGTGEPWKPDTFTSDFRAASKRAGFHIRFHDLRHTHATMLLAQGVHPKIVSERLGHSSIGITLDTYSHVLPNMQETAAEAVEKAIAG